MKTHIYTSRCRDNTSLCGHLFKLGEPFKYCDEDTILNQDEHQHEMFCNICEGREPLVLLADTELE